jgi:major membrane immunogen (membrane-anchored lipoprotein)
LVIQELLLLCFKSLILKVLVKLILLIAFTCSGHTYDKMQQNKYMAHYKNMWYDMHEREEHFMMIAMVRNQLKWSYGLQVMAKLINMI